MDLNTRHHINGAHAAAEISSMHPRVGCYIYGTGGYTVGYNQPKTHPMQAMWAKRTGRIGRIFLHAEMSALITFFKYRGDSPSSVYIVRLGKGGEYRPSFPCPVCYAALLHAGVKEIIYFDKSGTFSKFDCLSKSSQVLGE